MHISRVAILSPGDRSCLNLC